MAVEYPLIFGFIKIVEKNIFLIYSLKNSNQAPPNTFLCFKSFLTVEELIRLIFNTNTYNQNRWNCLFLTI